MVINQIQCPICGSLVNMEVVDVTFNNNRMIMGAECPECKRNLQIDAAIHFDDIKYVIPAIQEQPPSDGELK